MNGISDVKLLKCYFRNRGVARQYFDNVRRLCTSMEGALARIKSRPIEDPYTTIATIQGIRVTRFIPLSDELQKLNDQGIRIPRNIYNRLYHLETDMKSFVEQLEKQTQLR